MRYRILIGVCVWNGRGEEGNMVVGRMGYKIQEGKIRKNRSMLGVWIQTCDTVGWVHERKGDTGIVRRWGLSHGMTLMRRGASYGMVVKARDRRGNEEKVRSQ